MFNFFFFSFSLHKSWQQRAINSNEYAQRHGENVYRVQRSNETKTENFDEQYNCNYIVG